MDERLGFTRLVARGSNGHRPGGRDPRRARTRWAWPTVASTVVHGALLLAILISQFSREKSNQPPTGATVIDVMAVPVLPPAPQPQPPPPEAPKPKSKPRSELPPIAPPEHSLATEPAMAVPEHGPDPDPTEETWSDLAPIVDEIVTDPGAVPAPAVPQQAAPVEGNAPGAVTDAEPTWDGMVLAALERQKRYPAAARHRGEQDIVYVRMTIDREGAVVASSIHQSRGYAALDGEVLDLVRRASPLPKPPDSVSGDRIDLVVPIEFFLSRARR